MECFGMNFGWGTKYSLPIAIGYFPLGFAFGVMGREAGLTVLDIVLMSTLVFAGAAQFIAVGLIAAGVEAGAILITTFLVNIRHLLMSTALQPYFKGHSRANWD
jgi:4-azaleucine resistance transporter AzlC